MVQLLTESLKDGQALGIIADGEPARARVLTIGALKELLFQAVTLGFAEESADVLTQQMSDVLERRLSAFARREASEAVPPPLIDWGIFLMVTRHGAAVAAFGVGLRLHGAERARPSTTAAFTHRAARAARPRGGRARRLPGRQQEASTPDRRSASRWGAAPSCNGADVGAGGRFCVTSRNLTISRIVALPPTRRIRS